VFAGSSSGARPEYRDAAAALGRALAARRITAIYGGAHVGLMGAMADAALDASGRVIGVIPAVLVGKELAHAGLTELRVTASMHERKATMADLSDGFVALPGGLGTWEEFFEILTWTQLGLHRKPCGLLNVAGYFDPLLAFLRHAVAEGFVREAHAAMIAVADRPEALLDLLVRTDVPHVPKWIDRAAT
jgi:uncharacterized protein (TIGR00730 family)